MEVKKDRRPEVDTTNSKTRPIAYVNDARTAPYTSYSGARSFSKDSKTCKGVIVEKEGDTNLRSTQPEDNITILTPSSIP